MTQSNTDFQEKKINFGTFVDKKITPENMVSIIQSLDVMEYDALFTLLKSDTALSTKMVMKETNGSLYLIYGEQSKGVAIKGQKMALGVIDHESMSSEEIMLLMKKIENEYEGIPWTKKVKLYSFYAVKNSLENLFSMGIVGRRKVIQKRANELWFVNPMFRSIWLDSLQKIESRINKNKSNTPPSVITIYRLLKGIRVNKDFEKFWKAWNDEIIKMSKQSIIKQYGKELGLKIIKYYGLWK